MPLSRRQHKYNAQLQRVLSELINRHCDFAHDFIVTITRVETSPNLRRSLVWISVCPIRHQEAVWRVLTQERAALQRLLRRNWRAQPVPQITFRIDFGPAKAERVEKILRDLNLNKKKARKSPHGRL